MFYAVINSGGKQYRVSEGDIIEVDKLDAKNDEKVKFEQVLLLVSDGEVKVGNPNVSGVEVIGKVIKQKKGEKIRVAKFRAKSKYRRAAGFRAQLSELLIETIKVQSKSSTAKPKEEKPEVKKEAKSVKEEKIVKAKPKKSAPAKKK